MTSSLDASRAHLVSFAWPPTTEADSVTRIRQLERALASRHVIGIAQGILMERHGLTAEAAFEWLRRVSQNTNTRVADLAVELSENRDVVDRMARHPRRRPPGDCFAARPVAADASDR